jgi:fructose-bisphosphate aldolase class I
MISNGFVPIIEPEVDIHIADKKEAEVILKKYLIEEAKALKASEKIIFKLSLPSVDGYLHRSREASERRPRRRPLGRLQPRRSQCHPCPQPGRHRLVQPRFAEGLTAQMSDEEFNAQDRSVHDAIYEASIK